MSFCAVNDKKESNLQVIWDLGRRCTFACSYCPGHRRNNWSEMANFDELKSTADGLDKYHNAYNNHRQSPFGISVSFTGGEPTANKSFFPFLEYLQEHYPSWKRTLTTNGCYSHAKLETVMKNTDFSTISWHCEATTREKDIVRRNIKTMKDRGYGCKVNVMFHAWDEYFDECLELCKWLTEIGVPYTPRVIGDEGNTKVGLQERTVHEYTELQMKWMKLYWANEKKKLPHVFTLAEVEEIESQKTNTIITTDNTAPSSTKIVGQNIGRPCCGSRPIELYDSETKQWEHVPLVPDTNFQGWNCTVNWYFLYIHQEINQVWHHQTCQVNLDNEIGPICKASELGEFAEKINQQMSTGTMAYITCPKTHCGCGLCTPKAKTKEIAEQLFAQTTTLTPVYKEPNLNQKNKQTLKAVVIQYDADNNNTGRLQYEHNTKTSRKD